MNTKPNFIKEVNNLDLTEEEKKEYIAEEKKDKEEIEFKVREIWNLPKKAPIIGHYKNYLNYSLCQLNGIIETHKKNMETERFYKKFRDKEKIVAQDELKNVTLCGMPTGCKVQ